MNSRRYIQKLDSWMDNLRLLVELAVTATTATRLYPKSYLRHLERGWNLVRRHKYRPREALDIGLFDRAIPDADLRCFSSKQSFAKLQSTVNPLAWYSITEDKGIFYRYCQMAGIRVPKLFATHYRGTSGWTMDNTFPQTERDWQDFLERRIACDLVVKPTNAAYGLALKVYGFEGPGRWRDLQTREVARAVDIADYFIHHRVFPGFVLQERVRNHRDLERISSCSGLQTLRVATLVTRSGECRIIHSAIKLIVGGSLSDNFDKGKSGNLSVRIDPEKGVTVEAVGRRKGMPGVEAVRKHPQTQSDLTGIPIPCWKDVLALVRDAAYKFLPLRTIGWDIAVTDSGPVVIEANMRFDPPNQFRSLHKLRDMIANA